MKILISGAGIAGLSLAYWLDHFGFEPHVIDISPTLRNKGYMMDFFGSGMDVAEAMGLMPEMKKRDHDIRRFVFTDAKGKEIGHMKRSTMRSVFGMKYYSLMRGEFEDLLYQKIKKRVPIRFGRSIRSLKQDEKKVTVTYESGKKKDYDLVIGADGLRSNVRDLVFGKKKSYQHYLGYIVAAFIFEDASLTKKDFLSFAEVDQMMGIYPIGEGKVAAFCVWKSEKEYFVDPKKRLAHLKELFSDAKSFVPQVLDQLKESDEIYMDSVNQVKMSNWVKGRVTLVGDANACLTLLAGQSGTMAMAEGYILAQELKNTEGDYKTAFANYQRILQPIVEKKQKEAAGFASTFTPGSRWKLWLYNFCVRFAKHSWVMKYFLSSFDLQSFFGKDYPKPIKKP